MGWADLKVRPYDYSTTALFEKDARPFDLLAAQRAEEARDQPVHQLEVRRKRRRALVGVIKHFFPEILRVHHRAGAAVNENEFWLQDVPLALHVGAHGNDAPAAERVIHLFFALHDARTLVWREHDRAGDDQRTLILFTDFLP